LDEKMGQSGSRFQFSQLFKVKPTAPFSHPIIYSLNIPKKMQDLNKISILQIIPYTYKGKGIFHWYPKKE